jgi:hypothetical protein
MNKLFKTLSVLAIAITLFSCSQIREAQDFVRKVDTTRLKLGMSKQQVQEAIGKKPENIVSAVKNPTTSKYEEVVKYSYHDGGNLIYNYLLFFSNDSLESWKEGKPDLIRSVKQE